MNWKPGDLAILCHFEIEYLNGWLVEVMSPLRHSEIFDGETKLSKGEVNHYSIRFLPAIKRIEVKDFESYVALPHQLKRIEDPDHDEQLLRMLLRGQ